MNKGYVGQWYNEVNRETLNIFDETPLRMKMSFSSSGYYNYEPNCIYEKDGYFYYEINDEENRRIYRVRMIDGKLEGFYTQYGNKIDIHYVKVSDIPENLPFEYRSPIAYYQKTPRIELLKKYAEYDRSKENVCDNHFVFGGSIPEILDKYHYRDYINGLDTNRDTIVFRLLDFVCDHFGHNGVNGCGKRKTITDIVTFCESNEMKTNCRGLSILLASLLRLNGIKAQHITCMPYEEPFEDCHVVVDCLLPSGDRIMLDPTWRLYYQDKAGKYVSLPHLRELLIADEPIFENSSAGYFGGGFDKDYHRDYMIKNTVRFSRCTLNKDGVDGVTDHSRYLELLPRDYPIDNLAARGKENFVYNDTDFWNM